MVTNTGIQKIVIPSKDTVEAEGAKDTEALPIDVEVVVDDAEWIVCYDGEVTTEKQIRYVNWSGEAVYRVVD